MHLPAPLFRHSGSLVDANLRKFDAVVLVAVKNEETVELLSKSFADSTLSTLSLSFETILSQWPDYSAKSGEILEIPVVDKGSLHRLFILGIGSASIDDARKAGASLGRKVKSTGYSILHGYEGEYDAAVSHLVASGRLK